MNDHDRCRSARQDLFEISANIRREPRDADANQLRTRLDERLGHPQRLGDGRTVHAADDELAAVASPVDGPHDLQPLPLGEKGFFPVLGIQNEARQRRVEPASDIFLDRRVIDGIVVSEGWAPR